MWLSFKLIKLEEKLKYIELVLYKIIVLFIVIHFINIYLITLKKLNYASKQEMIVIKCNSQC